MNRCSCASFSLLVTLFTFAACNDGSNQPQACAASGCNTAGAAQNNAGASPSEAGASSGAPGTPSAGSGGAVAGSAGAPAAGGGATAGSGGAAGQTSAGGGTSGAGGSAGAAGAAGGSAGAAGSGSTLPKRVLLYDFNSTPTIPTTPQQLTFLKNQLQMWGYESVVSEQPSDISTANLAQFGAVAMINTCFEPFGKNQTGDAQTAALKTFVEGGGGLFGTHCTSVTFQSAQPPNPFNDVLGGRAGKDNFDGKSACVTTAEAHVSTAMLPATFDFTGNIDNEDYIAADTKVLVKCTWSGGLKKETAVSWSRTPGKGRVFYTNFAKVDSDLSDATLGAKHILLGLSWVIGR
jgi:type 1 glutamine amidotransferase